MTQEELQQRLGKSLQRAVKQYLKDGGKKPTGRVGEVVSISDADCELWTLDVSYGSINPPGAIFTAPL